MCQRHVPLYRYVYRSPPTHLQLKVKRRDTRQKTDHHWCDKSELVRGLVTLTCIEKSYHLEIFIFIGLKSRRHTCTSREPPGPQWSTCSRDRGLDLCSTVCSQSTQSRHHKPVGVPYSPGLAPVVKLDISNPCPGNLTSQVISVLASLAPSASSGSVSEGRTHGSTLSPCVPPIYPRCITCTSASFWCRNLNR